MFAEMFVKTEDIKKILPIEFLQPSPSSSPPGGGAPALPAACGEDLDPKEERTAWQEEPRKLEECGRALQCRRILKTFPQKIDRQDDFKFES